MSDLFAAAPASLRRALNMEVHSVLGATALIAPGTQTAFYNRLIGLGVYSPVSRSDVVSVLEKYYGSGCPFMVHVNLCCAPEKLPSWLSALGLIHHST